MVGAGLSIVKVFLFVRIGCSTYYRPERDWLKANAAVIDAINTVLEMSLRAVFWKCLAEYGSKAFPPTISVSIATTAIWD